MDSYNYRSPYCYNYTKPRIVEDFKAIDGEVEFDIRMTSYSGFYISPDCDVEMDIKFTIKPKQTSEIIHFK